MAGFSSPQIQFYYQDIPASSGKCYVYKTGTTTPVTPYADGGLVTPIANPITLDANGECKFYVGSTVNLRLDAYTSTGVFIETLDPVYVIPDLTGSGNSSISTSSGGYVNKFRNGTFDVAQRGVSGTITAGSPAYTFDGWIVSSTGANITWGDVGPNFGTNFVTRNAISLTGNTGMIDTFIKQRIESYIAANLANQIVTVQFGIYNLTGTTITPSLTVRHPTATDNYASTVTDIGAQPLQNCPVNAWSTVAYTFSVNSLATSGLEITLDFNNILNTSGKSIYITGADIRVTSGVTSGLNNSPPTPELRDIGTETGYCQRYLYILNQVTNAYIANGYVTSTNNYEVYITLPTTQRIVPSFTLPAAAHVNFNGTAASAISGSAGAGTTNGVLSISGTTASGLVAGNGCTMRWGSTTDSFVVSSEL